MRTSSAGRFSAWTFVAPVVLIVAVLVVVSVLQDALADDPQPNRTEATRTVATTTAPRSAGTTAEAPRAGATTEEAPEAPARTAARTPRTYVVRSGDTLGGIAERFGTSAAELQELNPQLDPTAMQPGDRVRVAA